MSLYECKFIIYKIYLVCELKCSICPLCNIDQAKYPIYIYNTLAFLFLDVVCNTKKQEMETRLLKQVHF